MTAFALRGLLGRKLRTVLTALAIVLGVAMVSGTYVLTDSIKNAFGTIFTETYRGTEAAITGKSAIDLSSNGTTNAPSFDESLLPKVKALPAVGSMNMGSPPSSPSTTAAMGAGPVTSTLVMVTVTAPAVTAAIALCRIAARRFRGSWSDRVVKSQTRSTW